MNHLQCYDNWLANDYIDDATKNELRALKNNPAEIEDRFHKEIEFGTGGIRGIIGAGTNRFNIYSVRKATQGLADFLLSLPETGGCRSVAIAYDSRWMSREFALETACVLAANGIKVYLYEALRSTPQLSFTVRYLTCDAGIVITASHNPPEYNGYKVYGPDGAQITSTYASTIINKIGKIHGWDSIKTLSESEARRRGLLLDIGEEIDRAYIDRVKGLASGKGNKSLRIIYSPLHGTGLMPVTRCLSELGYSHVSVVAAQAEPDSEFSTVKTPNPESPEAFEMGIAQAKIETADIVMITDPDCDRIGVAARDHDGSYYLLSGNQIGALLLEYILSTAKEVPQNGAIIKTIVTSDLGAEIAKSKGLAICETLTGFKYIGEKINEFEETGMHSFVFGYEESYGFLTGTFVRDKDAVIAAVMIAEMAEYYSAHGHTLLDTLEDIQKRHGHYEDGLDSFEFKGLQGQSKISRLMQLFRKKDVMRESFPDIEAFEDYLHGICTNLEENIEFEMNLPKSDVLKYILSDGSWFAVRPSGTEPKIKFYYSMKGRSKLEASDRLKKIKAFVADVLDQLRK